MQTLVQTQKMDHLEQEVHELREEVATLRAEVEKLTSLVSSLTVTQDQPQVRQKPLCIQLPRQQALQRSTPQDQTPRTQFDPIPMKYAELLSTLLERNLV